MNGLCHSLKQGLALAALGVALLGSAQATVINLGAAGVPGNGPVFCGAGNAHDVTVTAGGYDVVLSGGIDLGPNINFLPATSSVAYGTADFANGCSQQSGYLDTITIRFFQAGTNIPKNVTNFFIDLFNGNTLPVDYSIEDNLGNGGMVNIASNLNSGEQTFGIAAAGHTVTIRGLTPPPGACCAWDFFVDNIGFNQAINGRVVGRTPAPGPLWLLPLAIAAGWGVRRYRA